MLETETKTAVQSFSLTVFAFVIIGIVGALSTVAVFLPATQPGLGISRTPYTPTDLQDVVTNVRPRSFGDFATPPEEWGNRSPLLFQRTNAFGEPVLLGTLGTGTSDGSGGHLFTDGEPADVLGGPLIITVGDGGGVTHNQHLTIFDGSEAPRVLCFPRANPGNRFFFDGRGNPYFDRQLRDSALSFDCRTRLTDALVAHDLIDADMTIGHLYSPRDNTSGYIAFARANTGSWADIGCMGPVLVNTYSSWFENSGPCPDYYPPPPWGGSPMILGAHPAGQVLYDANIFMTWGDTGIQYYCMPETPVENYSELFYAASDGTLYRDPFFEDPALPDRCSEYLAQGFRPADIVNAVADMPPPLHGSIALQRGQMYPPRDDAPFFGFLDSENAWHDMGLGGEGGLSVGEETPLVLVLRNEGNEGQPISFSEANLSITTEQETFSVCVPQTDLPDTPDQWKRFFVNRNHEAFFDPFFLEPARCSES